VFSILFPPLLHEIFLKLIMCIIGPTRMIRGNETGDPMLVPPHLHGNLHQLIVGMIYIFATIILYNHVKHDDTIIHDISKALLVKKSCRSSHNRKLGLQNPKCSLHIFPRRRLCIAMLGLFLTFGLNNRLRKCLPPWVDAISKKVAIVLLVAICFKLYH
jgi:hypothetical protein